MDFHAIQGDNITHVMTTHREERDDTPLQMISSARLAYYVTLERALLPFIQTIVSVLPAAPPSEPPGTAQPSEQQAAA